MQTQSEINAFGILIRFLLGGGAVAASFVLARLIGGRWGGIFAAFPAVYIASVVTVGTAVAGAKATGLTLQVSRGALAGMAANVVCAITAFWLIRRTGWQKGIAGALVIWLILVALIYVIITSMGIAR